MQHYIVYSDEREPFRGRPTPYHEQDAVRHWRRHYANSLMLRFVRDSELATRQERRRALAELEVCDRRMQLWQRHPNFSPDLAAVARREEDSRWRAR